MASEQLAGQSTASPSPSSSPSLPALASGTITLGGDLKVNRLGYGAMRITGRGIFGPPADRDEAIRVLRRAVELGVDFIDTADSYGPNVSEELIAEALHPYPKGLVIATKGGFERPGPNDWRINSKPKHLRSALEGSLRRLKVEQIDLWQLHRIDEDVSEADQFGALADFVKEGLVRHVGLSEVGVDAIERARRVLPIVSVQNRYNVMDREWESVVDHCEQRGIGFIPWAPLGSGALTSKRDRERVEQVIGDVAQKHGATTMQVGLAWLLARSPAMLVIPGTSQVSHVEENIAAAALRLTNEDIHTLGALAKKGK